MRRGGHNRKSKKAKIISGTFRPDRDPAGLPASPGIPQPPLALTGEALSKWNELTARPGLRQILSPHDGEALAALCIHWAVLVDAYKQVSEDGVLIQGYRGSRIKHPGVQIIRDASSALAGYLSRFGMTPFDRGRITAFEEAAEDDEFEAYLRGGPGAAVMQLPQKKS